MSTGANAVFFAQKRILGLEDFDDRFMQYLRTKTEELFALTYNLGGVFVNPIAFGASGADKFSLTLGESATDGDGHVLVLDSELGKNIQFENSLAVTYFVGLRFAERPVGIQQNPRTGRPEFQRKQETIGDAAAPDSISDLGTNLEFVVDSVTEPGVNNAGRQVIVYKNVPGQGATSESVAIETLIVTWDGSNNKITTVANFGQSTPSTLASDYTLILVGPTVKRNTDLSAIASNAFLGTVLGTGAGNPPVPFDASGQNLIDTTLTGLDDITRLGTNLDLKVSVDAHPLDLNENQIEVLDAPSGNVVFSVDESGDVVIKGTLNTTGVATFLDNMGVAGILTVSQDINLAGDLTAGNADGDNHTFQGDLYHVSTAFGGVTFSIDGITGAIFINGSLTVEDLTVANTLTMDAAARVIGDFRPQGSGQDLGANTSFWDSIFMDGTLFMNDAVGVDRDAIFFGEGLIKNFSLKTNFSGIGDAKHLAIDTFPNNQTFVMNRLGETVWGTGITDADLDALSQMKINPQAAHRGVHVDMSTNAAFYAEFIDNTVANAPGTTNTALLVDNNSTTIGAGAGIKLEIEDEGGYLFAKRVANGVAAICLGQRVSVAIYLPQFFIGGTPTTPRAGFGLANVAPFTNFDPQAGVHLGVGGTTGRTSQAFKDNSFMAEVALGNAHGGFVFKNPSYNLFLGLDGADADLGERNNLSLYVQGATADNQRWWSMDMAQGVAPLDRNDSSGLMMYAGRVFTTPTGTSEKQAEQLVGLNQNKSIVCRGRINANGTLDTTNDQYLNIASVSSGGVNNAVYTITFVTPIAVNCSIAAVIDGIGNDDTQLQVVSQTTTTVVFQTTDVTTLEIENFRFIIIGRPNGAPSL